jgi:hypothetical protein
VRADHALNLNVAMATPPIRPHPARCLREQPERNGSSETTRQTETCETKGDNTILEIRHNKERNETKLNETKQKM